MRYFLCILSLLALLDCVPLRAAEPVRLILDTDIGNDIDDALALAMIHGLEGRAEVRLLAVTITKDNRWAAPYVDLVNTFYGHPDIPVGVVRNGKTPQDSAYIEKPAERRDAGGAYVYQHRILEGNSAPEAVAVLQKVLEDQPDQSVTIAQVGFSTNLTRLLKAPGGQALIARKVKVLCLMAGAFGQKVEPEYNVYTDPEAAQYLFANWPTPIVFSGFEIGSKVKFTYDSVLKDFNYTDRHPVAEAFKIFQPVGQDRPNWDSTAVLYAIRPDRGYFELSGAGRVTLGEKNVTVFTPDASGRCRYLILKPEQEPRVQATIEMLVSEPPQHSTIVSAAQ